MEDEVLISMFYDRNESVLTAVNKKYGGYCSAIARNILKNEQETEECINDLLMKVWEKIPPEKPRIFSAFLAKLTRNLAIDRYRKNKSARRIGDEVPAVLDELAECVSDSTDVQGTAERAELLAAINRFLDNQPKNARIAFVSRYCCCESVSSISGRLGISENNVSVILNRTRKKLREYLEKEGYEL